MVRRTLAGFLALLMLAGLGVPGTSGWPQNDGSAPIARAGFEIAFVPTTFASSLTSIAFGPDGNLWVTEQGGRILRVVDTGPPPDRGNYTAASVQVFDTVSGFGSLMGLVFNGSQMFVSSIGAAGGGYLHVYNDTDADGVPDLPRRLFLTDLQTPDGSWHDTYNLVVSGGWLYFNDGSYGNTQVGYDPLRAKILRVNLTGLDWSAVPINAYLDSQAPVRRIEIFARGVRNTYDMVALPNGDILGTDNNMDQDPNFPEELNHYRLGHDYGFPSSGYPADHLTNGFDPPVAALEPHSSANGIAYYGGTAWCGFTGRVFVAMWGPNSNADPRGRKVVAVNLTAMGDTYFTPDNATDVEDIAWNVGRPLDLTFAPDGRNLFVARHTPSGAIYRVWPSDSDGDGTADVCQGDTTAPSSTLSPDPPTAPYWRPSDVINATASASDDTGVASVELYVSWSGDNATWTSPTWRATDPSPPWGFSLAAPNGDGWYRLWSIAVDLAGNREDLAAKTSAPEVEVGVDTVPPAATVRPLPTFRTARPWTVDVDVSEAHSGVLETTLRYRYSGDNRTWGSWFVVPGTAGPWSFDGSDGAGYYAFCSDATDVAGNRETACSADEALTALDLQDPGSQVVPLPTWTNDLTFWVDAIATDDLGVASVELWVSFEGGAWDYVGTLTTLNGTRWSWRYLATFDGAYAFHSRARDNAGRYEAAPGTNDTWTIVDRTPPAVVSTSPSNGELVPPDTEIRVTFSEPVDAADVERSFFIVQDPGGLRVAGTVRWEGTTLVFTPTEPLLEGGTYVFGVFGGVDRAGNRNDSGVTVRFVVSFEGRPQDLTLVYVTLGIVAVILAVTLSVVFAVWIRRRREEPPTSRP